MYKSCVPVPSGPPVGGCPVPLQDVELGNYQSLVEEWEYSQYHILLVRSNSLSAKITLLQINAFNLNFIGFADFCKD